MSRVNSNPVRKYFKYDRLTDKSVCQIANCATQLSGKHAGNLERHLERKHKEEYKKFVDGKCSISSEATGNMAGGVATKKLRLSSSYCAPNTLFSPPLKVNLTADGVMDACVELVTTNGRPFRLMDDSGFKRIVSPIEEALGRNFRISAEVVRSRVPAVAKAVREKIKQEAMNRLISLKIDCATRLDRAVVGVNMQFIRSGKIVLRTLAMKELKDRHTSVYLKSVVLQVLSAYNISLNQVYTITTDNGANIVKSVKLLGKEQDCPEGLDSEDELDEPRSTDLVLARNATEGNNSEDQVFDDMIFSDDKVEPTSMLRGVRCAAHTLQLAVMDALKESEAKDVISKVRTVVKYLRKPSRMVLLRTLDLKKPILDCVTRWNSTCDMLKRLLELKRFCDDMAPSDSSLHLSASEWNDVSAIVEGLEPARQVTRTLQLEQLTLGDFYGSWIKLYLQISGMPKSPFIAALQASMKRRERMLLDNDAFRACIYLDPRYRVLLTDEDKCKAEIHLVKTWEVFQSILQAPQVIDSGPTSSHELSTSSSDDDLEQLLKARDSPRQRRRNIDATKNIAPALTLFQDVKRLSKDENVLEFWERQRVEQPDLYSLAQIVFAVPATQVSVERAFSGLKFILSPQRTKMTDSILEDVILILANKMYHL